MARGILVAAAILAAFFYLGGGGLARRAVDNSKALVRDLQDDIAARQSKKPTDGKGDAKE